MGIVSVLHGIQSSVLVKKKLQLHNCSILFLFKQKDVMSSSFANWYTPSLISGMFPGCRTLQSAGCTLRRDCKQNRDDCCNTVPFCACSKHLKRLYRCSSFLAGLVVWCIRKLLQIGAVTRIGVRFRGVSVTDVCQ